MYFGRRRLPRRRIIGALSAALLALAVARCGFPDHTFDDKLFFGAGNDTGGSVGQAGKDGGASGNGGTGAGGHNAGGNGPGGNTNSGGLQETGGLPANGGTMTVIEGGRPPPPDGAPDGRTGSGGSAGSGGDAAVDTGPTCAPGLDLCSGTCVDFLSNKNHCGDCTTACTGTNNCVAGLCSPPCDPGLTACSGNCVDLTSDPANCRSCGSKCGSGAICLNSLCVIDCGPLTRCPGNNCVDTTSDPGHCGDCTTACSVNPAQLCSNGVCRTTCQSPTINCNNVCVNTQTDDTHCGGCPGTACAQGKHCVGGTCQTLVENCQNGVDDDEDGKVDCDDTDCGAFTCAATPQFWTGPFALWTGAPGAAPTCAGAYPSDLLDAHDGLVVPTYTCPSCTCSSQNASCPALQFYFDTTTSCTSSSAWFINVDQSGACTPLFLAIGPGGTARSSQLVPPSNHSPSPISAYATGTCTGSAPAPNFPTPSWSADVLACGAAATSGACPTTGGQCLPKPVAPYKTKLCVYKTGANTCPSSYPNPMPSAGNQYYGAFTDNRSCSTCNCGPPSCGGTVTTYTDPTCGASATVVDITGGCTTIPGDPTPGSAPKEDTRSIQWTNGGAVCGTATSALNGAAVPDPTTRITVCCQN